jgi:hypothetical protein
MASQKSYLTESDIKVKSDYLLLEEERFKSFEENILPLQLDQMKDSYIYILQKLIKKSEHFLKYQEFSGKCEEQLRREIEEMVKIEGEVQNLTQRCQHYQQMAKEAIKYFIEDQPEVSNDEIKQKNQAKFLMLPFKAFYALGPEGTEGVSDLNCELIEKALQDRGKLANQMASIFNKKITKITQAEIENSEGFIREFNQELSEDSSPEITLAKAMVNFVVCCLAYSDLWTVSQSRKEVFQAKKDKIAFLKKEIALYRESSTLLNDDIMKIMDIYLESKKSHDDFSVETLDAKEALEKFETHYQALEKECDKETERDADKIGKLLVTLSKDCSRMDSVKERITYLFPPDTELA